MENYNFEELSKLITQIRETDGLWKNADVIKLYDMATALVSSHKSNPEFVKLYNAACKIVNAYRPCIEKNEDGKLFVNIDKFNIAKKEYDEKLKQEEIKNNNNIVLVKESSPKVAVFTEIPKKKTSKLKKTILTVAGIAIAVCGLSYLLNTNNSKNIGSGYKTPQVSDVLTDNMGELVAMVDNTQYQINSLSNILNDSRAYANPSTEASIYDTFLASNMKAVFENKEFMSSLNYYDADGYTMSLNMINNYQRLADANAYNANLEGKEYLDYSGLFLEKDEKEFAANVQRLSYDIIVAQKNNDQQKVNQLKEEILNIFGDYDNLMTLDISAPVKLYSIIMINNANATLKTKHNEIFTKEYEQLYLTAINNCGTYIVSGQKGETTPNDNIDQNFNTSLSKVVTLANDLRAVANGKVQFKLTKNEIVEIIKSKVNTEYKSAEKLFDFNLDKDYLGFNASNGNDVKVVLPNGDILSSGGINLSPEGTKTPGTYVEDVVDTSRGPETSTEVVGGEHDKDNDGKEDITGGDITMNPGGNYDPDIPMWDGNLPNPGNPGDIVDETFRPMEPTPEVDKTPTENAPTPEVDNAPTNDEVTEDKKQEIEEEYQNNNSTTQDAPGSLEMNVSEAPESAETVSVESDGLDYSFMNTINSSINSEQQQYADQMGLEEVNQEDTQLTK